MLRLARVLHATNAEGPYQRTAVWFQGCSIRCPGCINPHLFSQNGGFEVEAEEVVVGALAAADEGITFIGGEPLDQLDEALELAQLAQKYGLGVICFTGYEHSSLVDDGKYGALFDAIDLLVDGPFRQSDPEDSRALIGSKNQQFIHFTNRYISYDFAAQKNRLELNITTDGLTRVAGFATSAQLQDLAKSTRSIRRKTV